MFLKCENLQKVGAFKARGACNAVWSLDDTAAAAGVATHSSGNHGQALAWAGAQRGIDVHVVMPSNSPEVKKQAVIGYGARVIECAPTLAAREETLASVVAQTGAGVVHPYEDPRVIAGQSSATAELLEQVADLDVVIAPVGGGGLIAGAVLATRGVDVEVVGAEPLAVDDAARSLRTGKHQPAPSGATIADGLRTRLGALPFEILSGAGVLVETVSERDIVRAMRFVFERLKLVVEPSAAVPIAVVLAGGFAGKRVGVIVSGGNVDLTRFFEHFGILDG